MLIIEGTYPWYRGGVSEWVHQYLNTLSNYNFTILQVATDEYAHLNPDKALYSIPGHVKNFIRIPPPDFTFNWDYDADNWFQSIEINKAIKQTGFNLIHVTNTGFAGWLGVKLSETYNIPLILTEHALYWKEIEIGTVALECGYKVPQKKSSKDKVVQIFKRIATQVYRKADEVISVSENNIPYQFRLGAENPKYIPNGVSAEWVNKSDNHSDKLIVGWVGRCAHMKNPLKFFEFSRVMKEKARQDIGFLMMLSNSNENRLNEKVNLISTQQPYVNVIWNESAVRYMSGMNMLCITSINESQPLVLFEALAQHVLPVGWRAGDVSDKYGLIVDKNTSVEHLVDQVLTLWHDQQSFHQFLNEKRSRLKKYHTWDVIFDQYNTLINSLIE